MSTRRRVDTSIWDKFALEEGWFSFLALFLAFMTVVWSIEGAKWVNGAQLVTQTAIVGFLIGFGLSKVRFVPALLAHSFVISVGMVFVGLLTSRYSGEPAEADWSRRLGSTVLRVVRWSENAISGNARDDNLVYLVLLCFGIWLMGYGVSWTLFRGHKVWWTLLMLGSVLFVNLAQNPPNALFSFTFFLIVSLLLVVRFSAYLDEQRWRTLRLYFQPGLWRGAMAVGGGLVLVVVAIAFATPSSSQIDSLGQVINGVSQPFNGIKGFWDNVGSGGSGPDKLMDRSKSNYNSLDDSFTIGGPLRLSNQPVYRVTTEGSLPPIYMQAKTMDEYDGKGWINTYQTADGKKVDESLFRRLSLAAGQSLPTPPNKGGGNGKITLTSLVPGFNPVMTLGDLVSLDRQALVAFHYEKVTLNTSLDNFVLQDISDGADGKRSVLVDKTTGKVVPPAVLDLIKYLKEGAQQQELAFPPNLSLQYFNSGGDRLRITGSRTLDLRPGIAPKFTQGNWVFELPTMDELRALNLKPGGTPYTGKLKGLAVTNGRTPPGAAPPTLETSVYLNNSGLYTVTIESPLARGQTARDRFEATESGKKVIDEIKKLQEAVKGNKVSYTLTAGLPSSLQYEGFEPNYDDLTGAVLPQPIGPGESYTSFARRYRADVQSLRKSTPTEYPDWVKSRYLSVPENIASILKAQAEELTAGAATPYDKTMALVSYLNSLNYTLDPPVVPAGRDEIEFFLTDSKSGYCVHFSSSLALMLRTLDIPTRVVTGFIGGEYESGTNSWLVRGTAAHAWTQVYFNGIGWIDFEPTPGREGIQRPVDPSAVPPLPVATPATDAGLDPNDPANALEKPDQFGRTKNPKDPEKDAGAVGAVATVTTPPTEFPVWLLAAGLAILAGFGVYFARRLYRERLFAVPDPSPLVVYNRMSSTARRAGLRGRSGMTPNEYARYLRGQLPAAAPSVEKITEAYVRRRYGPAESHLEEQQRQLHLAAAQEAQSALHDAEKTGHDPRPEALWQAFKANSDLYRDDSQVQEVWSQYQEAVLGYRRDQRLERLTPEVLRKLRAKFGSKNPYRR